MIYHKQQQAPPSSQSGFTIIESLVAVIIAAVLLAAIAPVIVLSVATRVQAKRIELATDAAKTYIDGVKSGTIKPAPPITTTSLDSVNAPSGTLTCNTANEYCSSPTSSLYKVYCVDGDSIQGCKNDNSKDMVVQVFGYNSTSNNAQDGYKLGLRVYRADAFRNSITLKASKDATNKENKQEQQEQSFTGGTGLKPIQLPLVEMTTEISDGATTYGDFCDRLQDPEPDPNKKNPQSKCK